MKTFTPLLIVFAFLTGPLNAQSLSGDWYGILEVPEMAAEVTLKIDYQDGAYNGVFVIVLQGASLPVQELQVNEQKLTFKIKQYEIQYDGVIEAGNRSITGTYSQGNNKFPLNFYREKPESPFGSAEWVKARYTKTEVYVPMRDGTRLFTSIYTPKDNSRNYPILMNRTPYNVEPGGEEGTSFMFLSMPHLLPDGYILVTQDVRGRFMSEGVFEDVRPYNPNKKAGETDDNSDTYDTIDWLIKNVPGNNGRVGIFGVSYDGFYSTMALPNAHPALKAASPQAPVCNWFLGDDWHHNGAFFLMDAFNFYSSIGRPRPAPTRVWPSSFEYPNQDNYQFFLDLGPIGNVKTRYFGDTIQFWPELMSHPNYDEFWKSRDPRPHLRNLHTAVLTVGGWFDAEDCWGTLHTYRAIEEQNPGALSNRIIMGPWAHGQWSGGDAPKMGNIHWGFNTVEHYREVERNFFYQYLHGDGVSTQPEADIFITGSNEWRSFATWPPVNTESKTLYFQPAGGLSFSAPLARDSYDEYVADPMKPVPYTEDVHLVRTRAYMTDDQRFAARRPDVMVYQTEPLGDDVTLTGPLSASLFVSTTGTDADFVVKLIDVFPDTVTSYPPNDKKVPMAGYQMLVRGEVMRGRFRESFEAPKAFQPGKVEEVSFDIPDVAHTFKRGHRIMIQVQNSWFPLVDRNPQKFVNIYQCTASDFQKATHRVYHDAKRPSHVKVLVLGKK